MILSPHQRFPPPSSGEVAASYADGGGENRDTLRLLAPSVADYRDTSPEDGGWKGYLVFAMSARARKRTTSTTTPARLTGAEPT